MDTATGTTSTTPTAGRRHGLTAPVRVGGRHGPTPAAAKGPRWRRTSRGLYVPSHVEPSGLQRALEAGVLVRRYGAVTGWAAVAWHGGRWASGLDRDGVSPVPVDVALSRAHLRAQPGFTVCQERFDPRESERVDGILVTSAVRSVCFEMRYAPSLARAVLALDMAAYDDLVTVDEVAAWMAGHPSYTGIDQGRRAASLGSENSWSPMEVLTRVGWVQAGLPAPLANRAVFDLDGRHLMTPDLFDPVAGVGADYDGRVHDQRSQRRVDRDRQELYRKHHLECVVVMQGDLANPDAFPARLRAAYARAQTAPERRTWTTRAPSWWVDTSTVAARRGLDEADRARWLRYRAPQPG